MNPDTTSFGEDRLYASRRLYTLTDLVLGLDIALGGGIALAVISVALPALAVAIWFGLCAFGLIAMLWSGAGAA